MKNEKSYLTITELNYALNQILESELKNISFQGEISEFTCASSGHCYFTIKDTQSQISAVMWRYDSARLRFQPKCGDVVNCIGMPNVYSKTGRLQFILHSMVPAGEGELKRKFEELKLKLEKEGLFDQTRKRKIPLLPQAVGVVTSKTGAVIHDIMIKVKERMGSIPIYLVDARVQGEGAAQEIADGIDLLNRFGLVDVIIVARGGGSLEDLWAFNEEVVVRAVFASKIPIVSGVGHEVDITLCDLAADLRAPTPTAAAEFVIPKRTDLIEKLDVLEKQLCNYEYWLQPLWQELDFLNESLNQKVNSSLREANLKLKMLDTMVKTIHPKKVIENCLIKIENFKKDLNWYLIDKFRMHNRGLESFYSRLKSLNTLQRISFEKDRLLNLEARLENLSPQRVLKRGFALVKTEKGILRDPAMVSKDETISITLAKGTLDAKVL